MSTRCPRILVFVIALSLATAANTSALSLTLTGTGGLSDPIQGFSENAFLWADWTGGVAGSRLASYGFNPILPYDDAGHGYDISTAGAGGSLILSSAFTMSEADVLTVGVSVLTASSPSTVDVGFALLLEKGLVSAILANVRSDNINHFGDFGAIPGSLYAGPSAGVFRTATSHGREALTGVTLGGVRYGESVDAASCHGVGTNTGFGSCVTDVTSSYTPGAGTYQLLFGVYSVEGTPRIRYDEAGSRIDKPTAIAVKTVTTPEPGTLALLALAAFPLLRRRTPSDRITNRKCHQ